MSSIYVTEPPTNGKVLITTNRGEIEIELWSREAPKAARNFVQLCLEGYYIDTIFHRIVPDFIIQGGDPTATGTGAQSIFDEPFQDEFHSRLKYNRRGLVGMANNGKNDNGSQFFITLDSTPELQGKNTLFGRVMGDTIYNVNKMGQSELEEGTERPLYPPKITKTEVLVNPFDDIKPRTSIDELARRKAALNQTATQSSRKSVKKTRNLLSFEDEGNGNEQVVAFKTKKEGKSTHSSKPVSTTAQSTNPRKRKITPPSDDEQPALEKTLPSESIPFRDATVTAPSSEAGLKSSTKAPSEATDSLEAQIAALKSSLKRKPTMSQEPIKQEKLSNLAQQKLAYAQKAMIGGRKSRKVGEDDVMAALASFQSKISAPAPIPNGKTDKQEKKCALHAVPNCQSCFDVLQESDDDEGWYTNKLVFESDKLGKDASFRQRAEQELEMIDPREKAGRLALEAREQKRKADKKAGRNPHLFRDGKR